MDKIIELKKRDKGISAANAFLTIGIVRDKRYGISFPVHMKETPNGKGRAVKTISGGRDAEKQKAKYRYALEFAEQKKQEWLTNYKDSDYRLVVYAPTDFDYFIDNIERGGSNEVKPAPDKSASELIDYFEDARRFKALIKRAARQQYGHDLGKSLEFIRQLATEITHIADDLEIDWQAEIKAQQEKRAKASKILALMLEAGVTVDDIAKAPVPKKKPEPKTVTPIYQCIVEGQIIEYCGTGPVPTPMREYITENKTSLEALAL